MKRVTALGATLALLLAPLLARLLMAQLPPQGSAASFAVSPPALAYGGSVFNFSVTAFDSSSNAAKSYTGTVHFTSTDPQAVLPPDYTFTTGDSGTHMFSATLNTPGTQTITARDTANGAITGTSNSITVSATPPPPPPTFTLTDLGPLQITAAPAGATAFNASGQVTGFRFENFPSPVCFTGGADRAFLWSNGVYTELGTLGGFSSFGYGINNAGQIVGSSDICPNGIETGQRAFIWQNGSMTALDLSTNSNDSSVAFAINTNGDVAGYMNHVGNSANPQAVIWKGGTAAGLTMLQSLACQFTGCQTRALAINDSGQAAGWGMGPFVSAINSSHSSYNASQAVMWDVNGQPTGLGSLGFYFNDQANAINSKGDVAGYSQLDPGVYYSIVRAVVWQNGNPQNPQDLGTIPGIDPLFGSSANVTDNASSAWGINSKGEIVGISAGGSGAVTQGNGGRAFLYIPTPAPGTGGQMYDLLSLLAPGTNWRQLQAAWAINDNGQILGVGIDSNQQEHGFLLTPIITPTTTALSTSGTPSVFGQSVSFTATVTPAPPNSNAVNDTVTFYDGNTSLGSGTYNGNGVWIFNTIAPLSVGNHSITASYNGDNNFGASASTVLTQTVGQAGTVTGLAAPNTVNVGQTVTLTAQVTVVAPGAGTPTGAVTFSANGTQLTCTGGNQTVSTGQATCQYAFGTAGTESITASYGGDTNFTASTTATVTITVNQPVLSIVKTHTGSFTQGQTGALYTLTVSNAAGSGPTSGIVTVTDTPPTGLTLVTLAGTGWSCTANTCTRSDVLNGGGSYPPVTATVNVATNATSPQVNVANVSGGGSASASASDPTTITANPPVLSIVKTHTGSFTQGQTGVLYTLTVSNAAGSGPTSGIVTVTDTPPTGLTLVTLAGTGWSCTANTCTRSDVLNGGGSYPPITATVNVVTNATSPQVNVANVSGGGSASASTSDSTTITPNAPLITSPASGFTTTTPLVTVTGTGMPGASVTILDGTATLATSTADATGNFSANITLAVGTHSLTATQTLNGVTSAASAGVTVIIQLPPVVITDNETITVTDAESFPDAFDVENVNASDQVTVYAFFPIAISPAPPILSAVQNQPYSGVTFSGSGGYQSLTLSESGVIPGMSFALAGASATFSGTPTQAGTFPLTITATDSIGNKLSQNYSLTVSATCPAISVSPSGPLGTVTVGNAFSQTFVASGGVGTTTWSTASALPVGMNFSGGVLSGNPTQSGTFAITITATDQNRCQGSSNVSLLVVPPPAVIIDNETITVTDMPSFPDVFDAEKITVADQVSIQVSTTTSISVTGGTVYGTPANVVVSVGPSTTVTGNVTLSVDGGAATTLSLSSGSATFNLGVLKAGNHTLAANFAAQASFMGSSAQGTFVVNPATPTITWATPAAITYGARLSGKQLNAAVSAAGTTVTGTLVYNPPLGTVLGAGTQTLSVFFAPDDKVDYTKANTSVTLVVNQATPIITWANPAPITYGTALSSTQLNATSSVAGTSTSFVYTPAAGTVLTAGTQSLAVVFTPTDTTDYTTATATVTLLVNPATPTITWANPAPITYGTPISTTQLNATASVKGMFTYNVALGTVLGAGSQTLSAKFNPADTNDYTPAVATVTLLVNQATPTITWVNPPAITYGTALSGKQLNATVSWAGATVLGTLVYNPPLGAVLSAGSQTLSAAFAPNDKVDYTKANANVTLIVNRATPIITWANPAPITLGTPLSSTQLNATASVSGVSLPGTFVYNPPLKTVLGAGTQTLSVTFTPADTTDYQTVTATVSITVNVSGNLMVQSGQTYTFSNGTISGNVTLNGGTLTLIGGTVGGSLTMSSGSLTLGGNSTVNNNVQIQGGSFSIGSASIKGNLQITNVPAGPAPGVVCGASVNGDLQFQYNAIPGQIGPSSCSGNRIGGNLMISNNTAPLQIFKNAVGGNLQVQSNTGSAQVFQNTVQNLLQCSGNSSPFTGGKNTAAGKQGQCASF